MMWQTPWSPSLPGKMDKWHLPGSGTLSDLTKHCWVLVSLKCPALRGAGSHLIDGASTARAKAAAGFSLPSVSRCSTSLAEQKKAEDIYTPSTERGAPFHACCLLQYCQEQEIERTDHIRLVFYKETSPCPQAECLLRKPDIFYHQ